MPKQFDFSGYATRNDIQCSDGRIIRQDAFKDLDGMQVPLVWQHQHDTPDNVLGHVLLENREDGVYSYAKFNKTPAGQNAKELVEHGDVVALSIYANQLRQNGNSVVHGVIREVSLVLSGANPGAFIDNIVIKHSDGQYSELQEEAIIYSGEEGEIMLIHGEKTVQDVFDTFTDVQRDLVYTVLAHSANGDADSYEEARALAEESFDDDQLDILDAMTEYALDDEYDEDEYEDDEDYDEDEEFEDIEHGGSGGIFMKKNLFTQTGRVKENTLTHAEASDILLSAQTRGVSSLRNELLHNSTMLSHAGTAGIDYGVNNIEYLFPDAKAVSAEPDFIKRRTEWVAKVLNGTKKTPFARIKTIHADITADEARAKGYIKGTQKVEEVFPLLKRETTPTTIYKKQKLDRDDIIDVTTIDIVRFLKNEMRIMFDEERARAILIGDGRDITDADKIKEDKIRPIYTDAELYTGRRSVAADAELDTIVDEIVRARKQYKGEGTPDLFINPDLLTDLLLIKDKVGHRLYKTVAELASAMRVGEIIEVEVFHGVKHEGKELLAILTNLANYTEGADKGGEVSLFDDFDIDFNQHKYLMEARSCGAQTRPGSSVVIEREAAAEGTGE